jgi:pentatricopeptide repeat protein
MKNLANGYLGVGMLEKAITLYKELLEENSDDEVLYNLSSCYYLSNDLQAAKQMIGLAVSAQPHKK